MATAKKKYTPSAKSKAARTALIEKSQEAKLAIEAHLIKTGEEIGVNQMLLMMHQAESGCSDFKRPDQWKEAGFKMKKGTTAYRVWGTPKKASKSEVIETPKGEATLEEQYKFWPMCCLFNESQVEPFEADEAA